MSSSQSCTSALYTGWIFRSKNLLRGVHGYFPLDPPVKYSGASYQVDGDRLFLFFNGVSHFTYLTHSRKAILVPLHCLPLPLTSTLLLGRLASHVLRTLASFDQQPHHIWHDSITQLCDSHVTARRIVPRMERRDYPLRKRNGKEVPARPCSVLHSLRTFLEYDATIVNFVPVLRADMLSAWTMTST